MNVLSLFDGMSCGRLALDRAGIKVDNYFASEIDKYAITVAHANYPDTIQLGCVKEIDLKKLPKFDLLIGGSPCQGFSFAGKQLNFNDPRSKLFFEYARLLKTLMPRYFLLENVKMKKEFQDIISKALGVQPIEINSALVSAQNRRRLYWTNIPDVTQPQDKFIFLKDIIEKNVADYRQLVFKKLSDSKRVKGITITPEGVRPHQGDKKKSTVAELGLLSFEDSKKTYCVTAQHVPKLIISQENVLPVAFTERRTSEAKRIRKEHMKKYGKDFSPRRAKELVARIDGKMNCLTAVYSIKEHTLLDEQLYYRKLTTIECERLQTVPDNYTNHVSNSQRYKMLGNGWTIDVLAHIFKGLK